MYSVFCWSGLDCIYSVGGGKNERSKNIFSKQNLSGKVADQMQLETLAGVAGRISAVYLLGIWDAYCNFGAVC